MVTVAAGENWDDLVGPGRRVRLGRRRGALRHPRLGRRDPDPERRRLRPGGLADHRPGPRLGPQAARRPHVRQRRLRLRLPHQPVQGRPRPARRPRRHLPVHAGLPGRAGPVRRAGHDARHRAGRAGPARRRTRGGARSCARGKGMVLDPDDHDTWSAGSFFTNPVVDAAAVPDGAPAWPGPDGSVKTSAAWLIERAGLRQGLRPGPRRRPGRPLHQAHARAHQPGQTPPPRSCSPSPARSATGSRRSSGSGWSTSRCWSAASSDSARGRGQPGVDVGERPTS